MKGANLLIVIMGVLFILVTGWIERRATDAEDLQIKGVLDRFEGERAVIIIEDWNKEIIVPRKNLPADSKENMWFHIEKEDGELKVSSIDFTTYKQEQERVRGLMEMLK